MKTNKQLSKRIISFMLCVVMLVNLMPMALISLSAAEAYEYKGGAGITVSDLDTSLKFSESLGDNASTEYSGRIWTDKSVYASNATFDLFGGGKTTFKLNENKNGEDFLIAYSALATAESISGQTQAPVDVVLIIDISGSMSNEGSNMDNGKSRIYNTVQATNNAIDELMALNPYTRVAVVAFSSNAQVLLPLDRYTKEVTVEREWVSTGRNQGYWQDTEVTHPYFSLNRETGSNNYATLTTNAVNSSSVTVESTVSVEGGTNIQMGLYEGMKVLADVDKEDTKANINGEIVQRVPSVILLSDGSPTYSSNSASWWAPSDNYNDGPGSAPYAGNGMKAILVGSYMKDAIDRNYGVDDTAFGTTVYTIGMGITGLEDDEKNLAYMTLAPGTCWNDSNVTNSMKTAIKGYWATYTSRNNTGTLNINVGTYSDNRYRDKNYALTHPNTGYDVDPVNGYDYVDDYYDADNASAVISVFKEIVANIAISAPQVPTEIKGSDPMTDGYIIYTDPLGEYMEVKDVKAIIYAGTVFTVKSVSTVGSTTVYTFSGEVHSPVYGNQDIKDIVITVEEADGKQTLVVKIPASVIPLRVNEVMLNTDGSVKTHTNNGAMPTRVIYSVGLKSEIVKETADGTVYIDRTKISTEYLDANTNEDGTVNFYSNEYTNPHLINGSTVGDATVEFEPSHTNGFYYILEDMPIFADSEFKVPVKSTGDLDADLDDDTTYYYRDEYYHGNVVEIDAIERTGAQLKRTSIKVGDDGNLYREAGSPRLNRILKFEGTKVYNRTNTAEDFYAPEFHYADGSTSAYDGKFIVHLGNNGLLTAVAGGDLQISKTVTADDGLTPPDKLFEFTVELDGNDAQSGSYDYVIVNASGAPTGNGTLSASNNKMYLRSGETATVFSLPPETSYKVTETAENGFESSSEGATGTITAGETAVVSFVNNYSVQPQVWPANDELVGTKVLSGREWAEGDSFRFVISPYSNAPLPTGYDADKGVIVDRPDEAGGQTATFGFGSISFTAPGVFRYTVYEDEPENDDYLPGISYSRALYRVVVTVVDNGDGTLTVASSDVQRLYDDNANSLFTYDENGQIVMNSGEEGQDELVFTNTYSALSVTRVPVALKDYTDNSGQNPLASGMFSFKLEALGVVANGTLVDNSVSEVPMPDGSVNGAIITTNEGHNITFPSVTFTQGDIPAGESSITFRYRMTEVVPAAPVNGMTYDDTEFVIDVVVSVNAGSSILSVSAIYPDDENIATFKNVYTPTPVDLDIEGSKTLNGRDMKSGEVFEFVLGADVATQKAINEGIVSIPAGIATVSGADDGVKTPFAFENVLFKKAGTYVFTVSETKGNAASVVYDDSVITVTVVIDDANKDGNLEVASVTYSSGRTSADFVNTYTSEFDGDAISLGGTKTLTGKTLLAGEFYFAVEEYFNGTLVSDRFVTHTADIAGTNGVYTGTIVFIDNATYDMAGTYEYYISELIPNLKVGGTTYDESKYRFTVTVADDMDGNLEVTDTKLERANGLFWEALSDVVFSNTYLPTPTSAVLPLINKVIDGDRSEPLKDGEFEFEMTLVSATADGITLPANTVVSNAANGNIIFDAITFTKAGTYVVAVREIVPADEDKVAGITYSSQTITAVYHVVDDRNGTLSATLTQLIGGENIINLYKADPAEVTIEITKDFTGRNNDEWLSTDAFEFEINADADTLTAIENGDIEFAFDNRVISAKDGKISADVKINKPGTYKFVVSEVKGSVIGVSYDISEHEVVIVATDDSANAKIVVSINGESTDKAALKFTNEYTAEASAPVEFTAKKLVTASSGNSFTLKGGEFEFIIEGANGAPMPAITSASNDKNGNISFGSVAFDERGTYIYTVREAQGSLGGITYDSEVYTVTVEVTDDYASGKLVAKTAVTNKAGDEARTVFENKYNPEEVSATIYGTKTLEGGHLALAADMFEFSIKALTEGAPMPDSTSVKNSATGTFQFDAITFTKVGTYKYEITESDLGKDGYTYDSTVYTVTVTVTDDGDGKLKIEVDGVGTPEEPAIKFVNKYVPEAAKIELGVNGELKKELDGRELKAEEFIFTVFDGEGNEIVSAKNDQNGAFAFTLSFTKAGTYNYTIAEKNNGVAGVIYDEKVYGIEIVIVDNNGHLELGSVTYTLEGNEVDTVVFGNTYETDNTEIIISAIKTLTGRDLEEGEFEFALADVDGNVIATVVNAKDGKILFEKIVVTDEGTFAYTVYEVIGTDERITYDDGRFVVEVTVVDDGEGKLVVSETVIKDAYSGEAVSEIVFENTYTAEEEPPMTGDSLDLGTWAALALISAGAVITLAIFNKKRRASVN